MQPTCTKYLHCDLWAVTFSPCVTHCTGLLLLCITCRSLCTYSEKVRAEVPPLCLFWREARYVRWAMLWRKRSLTSALWDPCALLPLPNFRLVLPVQHMTLSLCCLTKHWLCLSTHSQAGSTNEIRAMPKRKVALNIKTGKKKPESLWQFVTSGAVGFIKGKCVRGGTVKSEEVQVDLQWKISADVQSRLVWL